MRIDHSNKKKKIIIITLLGLVVLIGGVAAFALTRGNETDSNKIINGVDYNPPTDDQKNSGNEAKKEFTDKAYPSEGSSQNPPDQTKEKVDISVTNHGPSGGVYQFRTLISTTTPGGTCTLTMTSDGRQTISKTIDTQVVGSYSVCAGYFDVSLSDLAGATWKTSIKYQNTQSEGSTSLDVKVD